MKKKRKNIGRSFLSSKLWTGQKNDLHLPNSAFLVSDIVIVPLDKFESGTLLLWTKSLANVRSLRHVRMQSGCVKTGEQYASQKPLFFEVIWLNQPQAEEL
jgi:hypothetical protein